MNATEVKAALKTIWPDEEYLHLEEACANRSRQGSKIDVLVCSCWSSHKPVGLGRIAVEVKVSYGDWKREIQRLEWWVKHEDGYAHEMSTKKRCEQLRAEEGQFAPYESGGWTRNTPAGPEVVPKTTHRNFLIENHGPVIDIERRVIKTTAKSAEWRDHSHLFYVAAPAKLAEKIRPELPDGWGLVAVDDDSRAKIVVRAKLDKDHKPTQFSWPVTLGLLRCAADAGINALGTKHQDGVWKGRKAVADELRRTITLHREQGFGPSEILAKIEEGLNR